MICKKCKQRCIQYREVGDVKSLEDYEHNIVLWHCAFCNLKYMEINCVYTVESTTGIVLRHVDISKLLQLGMWEVIKQKVRKRMMLEKHLRRHSAIKLKKL